MGKKENDLLATNQFPDKDVAQCVTCGREKSSRTGDWLKLKNRSESIYFSLNSSEIIISETRQHLPAVVCNVLCESKFLFGYALKGDTFQVPKKNACTRTLAIIAGHESHTWSSKSRFR